MVRKRGTEGIESVGTDVKQDASAPGPQQSGHALHHHEHAVLAALPNVNQLQHHLDMWSRCQRFFWMCK